ncbi:diablo IAP-binding mitochondrial protein [Carassius gibelio]|uniref:diablo IAP-binding mitochondrial protein n=1 Tax=Carassius gibelio TaxID=101364 RepID=UPI0022792794|nr:diablo IAP-binding mitochondrial protein [Carassius gibelio]
MAVYRRKLFAVGLSWASSLMSRSFSQRSRRLAVLPTLLRNNWKTLSVTGGLCAVPFIQKPDNLSNEDRVLRASFLITNSAKTYLSQTTLVLLDSISNYVKAMRKLVTLQKHYEDSIDRLSSVDEDKIWQLILRNRQEVIDRRKDCKKFESCWKTAINLAELAAKAAFNAGADQASVTTKDSVELAKSQVEELQQMMLITERQLKDSEAEESERL